LQEIKFFATVIKSNKKAWLAREIWQLQNQAEMFRIQFRLQILIPIPNQTNGARCFPNKTVSAIVVLPGVQMAPVRSHNSSAGCFKTFRVSISFSVCGRAGKE